MTTGPRWPEVSRHLRGRAVARVSRFGTWEPTAAVFLLVICLLLPPIAGAQVKVVRRVLILNELGAASPAINLIDGEIRDRLERSPYQIELYVESLETTLFPDPATQKEFLESYIHKYRDRKPDVIIAVGPSPLHFLTQSHEKFFADTPVVFCVSTPEMVGNPKFDSSFTGVWEMPDFTKTLEAALKLLPETRHIVVVGGVAAYDRANEAILRDGLHGYEARFDITYLTDLDMPTLLERLKRLPTNSIILQAGISEDAAGTRYIIATQSNPMVAQNANAPVFPAADMADVDVGQGAIGGYVVSFSKEGQIVADDAARILDGEKPKDIPIVRGANAYVFDWRALKRWGLKERDLPPGSLVLYRQPSFWELYRRYIVLGLLVFLAQLVAIASLLWQRAQTRKAQTQLVRSFGELHESEERFRSAMQNVASGLYTLDLQGLVTYVNPAAEAMFQWTNADLLGKKMHDVTHYKHPDGTAFPASDCPGLQVLTKAIELREHQDAFIRKDGSFFPVVFSASPLKRGDETIGVVVGFRDDTLRQQAERAIQESEERFQLVANSAPVMIWMSGVDKLCIYFNQPWLAFTGRSLQAELGNGWAEGVHPDDLQRCLKTYQDAFGRREPFQMEYRLRRHDGEYRWISNQGVPRYNSEGSFAGYIGSCIDVSERRLAEEALASVSRRLIRAQEEERTWIARELHDDFNQRIALLAMNLETLKQDLPTSKVTRRIEEARKQTSELASDIQTLSHRLHSSKLELQGLIGAARGLCRELSDRHNIEITLRSHDIPKELPQEVALCLFRVLQEALQNAVKHSGVQQFEVSLKGALNEIELTVHDAGTGFDPAEAMSGHGLGLTSMRERLKLVNGQLSIDFQSPRGTTIRARVPLSPDITSGRKFE